MALLEEYQGDERLRVIRCIVHLARGSTSQLLHFIASARIDYRDVIHWAEYDGDDRRVRDFSQAFVVPR